MQIAPGFGMRLHIESIPEEIQFAQQFEQNMIRSVWLYFPFFCSPIRREKIALALISHYSLLSLHFRRSVSYNGASNFNALLTPITFLISYFNSAINPLLYAFLSRNFRKGMREIILCSLKKDNTKSLQQRIPMHVSKSLFWHIIECDFFTRFLAKRWTRPQKMAKSMVIFNRKIIQKKRK